MVGSTPREGGFRTVVPTAKDLSHVQTRQSGAQLAAPQIVDARDGVYAAILEASPSACFLFIFLSFLFTFETYQIVSV